MRIRLLVLAMISWQGSYGVSSWSPNQIMQFTTPIIFNKIGIEHFFRDIFNHRAYSAYFMPAGFQHLIELISYADRAQDKHEYLMSIIDLFHVRLKECTWVNPYALIKLLNAIIERCAPPQELFTDEDGSLEGKIKRTLYKALLARFQELKRDPELFMSTLASEIAAMTSNKELEHVQEMQHAIGKLIESTLDKLVWSPEEEADTWDSCQLIADQLATLHRTHIIANDTTLNHCYWSLLYRYCYFIETVGDQLSLPTLQAIKRSIVCQETPLLTFVESEPHMLSKTQRLQVALFEVEVKLRSEAAGIWVQ